MARTATISGRDWDALKESTRRRYARYGITPSYYESGGSLQRARGHHPLEHVTRRERNPLGLTGTDYRFLKAQQKRSGIEDREDFEEFIDFYRSLGIENRSLMRKRVFSENVAYKKRKHTVLRKLSEYINELKNSYPWFNEHMVALMFYH